MLRNATFKGRAWQIYHFKGVLVLPGMGNLQDLKIPGSWIRAKQLPIDHSALRRGSG